MDRALALEFTGAPQLIKRLLDFNQRCYAQAAALRQQQLAHSAYGSWYEKLSSLNPELSLFALKPADVLPPLSSFQSFGGRLALLTEAELKDLCLLLGAARRADALSHIVRRTELAALTPELPEDWRRWVCEYGRFALPPRFRLHSQLPKEHPSAALIASGAELLALYPAQPAGGPLVSALLSACLQKEQLTALQGFKSAREQEQLTALCLTALRRLLGVTLG